MFIYFEDAICNINEINNKEKNTTTAIELAERTIPVFVFMFCFLLDFP